MKNLKVLFDSIDSIKYIFTLVDSLKLQIYSKENILYIKQNFLNI